MSESGAADTRRAQAAPGARHWKRRVAAGILCFVALWPAVQRGLVVAYQVDPWEFFGWAMYSVVSERVQVGIELEKGGVRERLRANSEEFGRLQSFARRRAALGRLASSEDLARKTLAAHPEAEALAVITRRVALDPQSARLAASESEERFER